MENVEWRYKRKSNEETETSEKSKVESCLETISISMNEAENRKSVLTKRNVKKAQKMKQTKAESALRQARKDLNDLEKKHNEMRRKYEKEIKKLNAKLKSISSSSKQDAGKCIPKIVWQLYLRPEVNAIKTQFESLTGLCVEPDQNSPHKLQCTVLNRPARKGVKFVISLPDESDPGCQYIPIANCHLLPSICSVLWNLRSRMHRRSCRKSSVKFLLNREFVVALCPMI